MMNLDDDESVFEQALRGDLPTMAEQKRLRQRMLAAGIIAGTALGSTNVAAAAQTSFAASALSKLSALSLPAKLGLAALLAAPVAGVALPLVEAPLPSAALVSQVRSSAARVRAHSLAMPAGELPEVGPTRAPEPAQLPPSVSARPNAPNAPNAPKAANASNALSAPSAPNATNVAGPVEPSAKLAASPNSSALANGAGGAAAPAVAAFDSLSPSVAVSPSEPQRNASTLAAETQLLDGAFAALAAGDRSTAQALIAEHARRFPNGILRQERERARARLASNPKGE